MERPTLLLIEDHPTSRLLARSALVAGGYDVHEARDAAAALAWIEAHRPQLIIQDMQLPGCDALQLAQRLRAAVDGSCRWIALSGLSANEELARIWESGFHDVLAKPVEPARLLAAVEEQLARARAGGGQGRSGRAAPQPSPRDLLVRSTFLSAELAVHKALCRALSDPDDVEGTLISALSACFDASGCSLGALYLADRFGQLRMRPLGPVQGGDVRDLATFYGHDGWLRELMQQGHPRMMMVDVADPEPAAGQVLARARALCGLVVPLIGLGAPLGVMFAAVRAGDDHGDLQRCRAFVLTIAQQVVHVLSVAETLRAQKVAEREAEQQRRLAREQAAVLRALVECAPDLVMQLDRAGKVRFSNRPLAAAASLEGASWYDAMAPEYRDEMRAALAAVLRDGRPKTIETRTTKASGASACIESHIGPVRTGSEIVGAVVIQRDVSHKKQADAQLMIADRLASVSTLAAGIAHEINNPLASVMANLELALHEVRLPTAQVSEDLREELRDARTAADRVRTIVRDLHVFARGDESRTRPVEIDKVLDSAVRLASLEVRPRARLYRRYEPVPMVDAEQARLGQVFLHLIISAAHGVEPGRAEEHQLAITLFPDAAGNVVVDIHDGAAEAEPPEAELDQDQAIATGIGLAMCHRVITALGGTLAMRPRPGRITAFRVLLPRENGGRTRRNDSVILPQARFLVVSADAQLAQRVRGALASRHDVLALPEPAQALARLRSGERFAAILCELLREPASGMDFYGQLARAYPEQAERVVFVTGEGLAADAERFLKRIANLRIDRSLQESELEAVLRGFAH